jgi:hypothetical protein
MSLAYAAIEGRIPNEFEKERFLNRSANEAYLLMPSTLKRILFRALAR